MCESQYEWLSVSVCYPSLINEPVLHRVCNPGLSVVFHGSSFADILLVILSFSLHLLKQHVETYCIFHMWKHCSPDQILVK